MRVFPSGVGASGGSIGFFRLVVMGGEWVSLIRLCEACTTGYCIWGQGIIGGYLPGQGIIGSSRNS